MPFRVKLPQGVVEADTAEEALALLQLARGARPTVEQPRKAREASTPEGITLGKGSAPARSAAEWAEYTALLVGGRYSDQRETLLILHGRPAGFTLKELMQATKAPSKNAIGGTIGALRRKAKMVGLEPEHVIRIQPGHAKKRIDAKYLPGPVLLANTPPPLKET